MSEDNILFFGLLTTTSMACWNSRMSVDVLDLMSNIRLSVRLPILDNIILLFCRPYLPFNIVTLAQNNETLQFSSGVKVVKKDGFEELLVASSKFPNYLLNKMNSKEVNFRILSASVRDLVRNTACEYGTQTFFPESYQTFEINSWK